MIKLTAIPGALRRPVSRRVKVRRSTALMVVLFIGLGALWLEVRTPSTSSTSGSRTIDQVINSGLKPGETLTITRSGTTTTIEAPTTSTTRPETSTTVQSPSTTESGPGAHTNPTGPQGGQEPTTTPGVSPTTPHPTDASSTSTTAPKFSTSIGSG
jgi:hypothetical protein